MSQFAPLFKREFLGYFRSPVAYVFIVVFLLASVGCTFFLGGFYESNQASLSVFFAYLPWLYLVYVPAVGMRLWAEERRSGTIELLFTMPISLMEAVLAKFMAGWAFLALGLVLTFPLAFTAAYLGDPDIGVMLSGYLGSLLMAGAYLAVACCTSALTKNQVISFILGVVICFVMVLLGWGVFTNVLSSVLPTPAVDFISSLGFMNHFQSISRGLIDTRDLIYFASLIGVGLVVNSMILNVRKAS